MFNRKLRTTKQSQSSPQSSNLGQTRKKEREWWLKLRNRKHSYEEEIKKQKEHMNEEIANVDEMLKDGSISKDIHARYLKLLEIGYAEKIQETRVKFGF
jgi:hypothetical protein